MHHLVLFQFQSSQLPLLHEQILIKFLQHKLTRKTKWNGRIVIAENQSLYIYNVFTNTKEVRLFTNYYDLNKVHQLHDGNFLFNTNCVLYECTSQGVIVQQTKFMSGRIANIVELDNSNVLFVLSGILFQYDRKQNRIKRLRDDIAIIKKLKDGRIFTVNNQSYIKDCKQVLDISLKVIRTFQTGCHIRAFAEYKPGVVICDTFNGFKQALHLLDLETGDMTKIGKLSEECTDILVLENEMVVAEYIYSIKLYKYGTDSTLLDIMNISRRFDSIRHIIEIEYAKIAYGDKNRVCVLDAITQGKERYDLSGAEFVSFVMDLE